MNREKALVLVKEQITERRYIHTLGVLDQRLNLLNCMVPTSKKQNWQQFFMIMQNFVQKRK